MAVSSSDWAKPTWDVQVKRTTKNNLVKSFFITLSYSLNWSLVKNNNESFLEDSIPSFNAWNYPILGD
jgi:hypothetical protein